MTFKPMKGDDADLSKLVFPYMVTPKYDGHRCLIKGGVALTSALKPFPNQYIQGYFSNGNWNGLDGELVVGSPTAFTVFRDTSSGVRKAAGEPDFTFYVFDTFSSVPAVERWKDMAQQHNRGVFADTRVVLAPMHIIDSMDALLSLEESYLAMGYEGLMLRSPGSPYKFGRATVKENYLLKLKRFADGEAVITGFGEQMANTNEKKTNALGRSERSSAKAGKVGKSTLGLLVVRGINGEYKDVNFEIGTGFDDALRQEIWDRPEDYLGKVLTYKYQPIGGYDKPRIPVFKGFRDAAEAA